MCRSAGRSRPFLRGFQGNPSCFPSATDRPELTTASPSHTQPRANPLNRVAWLIAAAFTVVVVDLVRFYEQFPSDDAYITMRVGRSWIETGAPYFNRGDAVMGHSSHLWLWLTTLLMKLFGLKLGVLVGASMVLYATCFVLLVLLFRRTWPDSPLRAVATAVFVMSLCLLPFSATAMETPLVLALLLGTLLLMDRDRDGWVGFVAALAFVCRYEMVLLLPLAFLQVRRRGRFVLGTLGPLLAFVAFCWGYFRTLIPQTITAKSKVYTCGRDTTLRLVNWPFGWRGLPSWLAAAILIAAMIAMAVWAVRRQTPAWVRVSLQFGLLLTIVRLAFNAPVFTWYWPMQLTPAFVGACAAAGGHWRRWAAPLALVLTLGSFTNEGVSTLAGYGYRWPLFNGEYENSARVEQYLLIGRELRESHPDATIVTSEIGGLGWAFYPGRIVDGVGLVTPAAVKFHPMKVPEERMGCYIGAIPAGIVREVKPELIVSMPTFADSVRTAIARGELPYRLAKQYPIVSEEARAEYDHSGVLWNSRTIDVWERVGPGK